MSSYSPQTPLASQTSRARRAWVTPRVACDRVLSGVSLYGGPAFPSPHPATAFTVLVCLFLSFVLLRAFREILTHLVSFWLVLSPHPEVHSQVLSAPFSRWLHPGPVSSAWTQGPFPAPGGMERRMEGRREGGREGGHGGRRVEGEKGWHALYQMLPSDGLLVLLIKREEFW